VSDIATGLMWQQATASGTFTWQQALVYAESLNNEKFAGHHDWRLPNIHELQSILDYTRWQPASIDITYFPDTVADDYWSSTTSVSYASQAQYVYFGGGNVGELNKWVDFYVRCVRGGQFVSSANLTIILDPEDGGTVTGPGISCGNGNTDCQESYALGSSVTLTAQANSGYEFLYWDDGIMTDSDDSITFVMDTDKTLTAKFHEIAPECDPPRFVYADNAQAHGLFEGAIKKVKYDGIDATTSILNIEGTKIGPLGGKVQFWVKVNKEYDPGYIAIGPNWKDKWGGIFADWGYIPPGNHVSYKLSFCSHENISFELNPGFEVEGNWAPTLTVLDAIIGTGEIIKLAETPWKLIEMLDKLGQIPLLGSAVNNVRSALQVARDGNQLQAISYLNSAVADLTNLASNKTQREELSSILIQYGLKKGSTWIFKRLFKAPFRAFEIFGDFIVYIVQTDIGASLPRIEVVAN